MPVWVLSIIIAVVDPGLHLTPHILSYYPDRETCETELKRVGGEMHKAYPHDYNFMLVCSLGKLETDEERNNPKKEM